MVGRKGTRIESELEYRGLKVLCWADTVFQLQIGGSLDNAFGEVPTDFHLSVDGKEIEFRVPWEDTAKKFIDSKLDSPQSELDNE